MGETLRLAEVKKPDPRGPGTPEETEVEPQTGKGAGVAIPQLNELGPILPLALSMSMIAVVTRAVIRMRLIMPTMIHTVVDETIDHVFQTMQQIAGALGYGGTINGGGTSRAHSGTVLISPPSLELQDRMYTDLINSYRYSLEEARMATQKAEKRAQDAEARIHELHLRIIKSEVPLPPHTEKTGVELEE